MREKPRDKERLNHMIDYFSNFGFFDCLGLYEIKNQKFKG